MRIGIIGSGLMGSAIGGVWAKAGHQILFSYSRDMRRLEAAAQAAGHGAQASSPADAAQADVVLLATTWHTLDDALAQAGSLRGKPVLSCMLPMKSDDSDLAIGFNTSGAETLAARTGAHVVATFNTVWSDVIRAGGGGSMFYVGDDPNAKHTASTLIRDAGFEPVDAGSLENARQLEPFGLLMGKLGFAYNPRVAYQFLNG